MILEEIKKLNIELVEKFFNYAKKKYEKEDLSNRELAIIGNIITLKLGIQFIDSSSQMCPDKIRIIAQGFVRDIVKTHLDGENE